jgi:hypothetical protein
MKSGATPFVSFAKAGELSLLAFSSITLVILSEAKDLCIFRPSRKIPNERRDTPCFNDFGAAAPCLALFAKMGGSAESCCGSLNSSWACSASLHSHEPRSVTTPHSV